MKLSHFRVIVNYQMQVGSIPIPQPVPTYNGPPLSEAQPIYPPASAALPMLNEPFVPLPQPSTLSQYESSWRSKFPTRPSFILFIVQIVLTILIFIMEIASLGVTRGFRPTGVGIWCAIPFTIASDFTFILGKFICIDWRSSTVLRLFKCARRVGRECGPR